MIVSYRSAAHLPRLLGDLATIGERTGLRVVVVDNDSGDGSAEVAEAFGAHVVRAGANLGYSGGLNRAREHVPAGSPVLVLNPDLSIRPDAIEHLLDALREPGVGVAVPTIVEPGSGVYPSLRNEPSIGRAVVDALLGRHAARLPSRCSEMVWSPAAYRSRRDTDWATGAALLISPACAAAVGDWDERYFLYSEETDFFRRVREAGLRTTFVPAAVVEHEGGGSGSSPALVTLMAVNRVRYFEAYHGRLPALLFRAVVVLHAALRPHDPGQRAALRAVLRRSRWSRLLGGPQAPTS